MQRNREIFRAVDGFDNYEISNHGRVRNVKSGKIIVGGDNGYGYLRVSMCKNGKQKSSLVHKMVAKAFLEEVEGKHIIDHIDHNRKNNNIENLRYVDWSGNGINKLKQCNNTSGYAGVSYWKVQDAWRARWQDEDKNECIKTFACKKYGEEKAKQLAIEYRKKMEKTLPHYKEALKHQTNDE